MRRSRLNTLALALLAVIMVAGCGGCVTSAARDQLTPLASSIYSRVHPSIEQGLDAGVADGTIGATEANDLRRDAAELGALLEMGDHATASDIDWHTLEPWATRGVQERVRLGELSEATATSFYERILTMRELLGELGANIQARAQPPARRAYRIGGYYLGRAPRLDPKWRPVDRHNSPRVALGVDLLTDDENHY